MNDAKRKILARRAQFVAAALAGLAGQACGKTDKPEGLVQPAETVPDAAPLSAPPMPCLTVTAPHPPAPAPPPRPSAHPADCNPPWKLDAQGNKIFKKECL